MDSFSLNILKLYNTRNTLTIAQVAVMLNLPPYDLGEYIIRLKNKSFLCIEHNHPILNNLTNDSRINIDTPLQITIDGKIAIENAKRLDKQRRNDLIRYIITTTIAIAAFIKSFFF